VVFPATRGKPLINTHQDEIYDEAGYDLSIDYTQLPPPPLLSEPDQQKLKSYLERS
jgi:hypothetical protein